MGHLHTVETLHRHPVFLSVVQNHSQAMLAQYAQFKELMRFIGSHQKWLLTYIIYRRWILSAEPGATTRLCMTQICDDAVEFGLASRNTVAAFVDGLIAYGFLEKVPGSTDRRVQDLRPPEHVHMGVFLWFVNHSGSLDLIDGGKRATSFQANPDLMRKLQPAVAGHLLADPHWRKPPENVELFYAVKNGFFVLEHLIAIIDPQADPERGYCAGPVSRSFLASEFAISRSTLYRMLDTAIARQLIAFEESGETPLLYLSPAFVDDYCRWQARKFAAVHAAFAEHVGE